MPLALVILALVEQLLDLAAKIRANNAQTQEMTPEQEREFDQRVLAIRTSPEADPKQNT